MANLDSLLEPTRGGCTEEGSHAHEDAPMNEVEEMGRLDVVDDSDSEALLEIARRLNRARRA